MIEKIDHAFRMIGYFFDEWYYMNDYFYISGRDIGMFIIGSILTGAVISFIFASIKEEEKRL